jgi:hypothetical protein
MSFTAFAIMVAVISFLIANHENFTEHLLTKSINLLIATEALYILTIALVKLMLGFFFLRILMYPAQRKIVVIAVGIFTVYSFQYFFFVVFQCGVPTGGVYWTRRVAGQCVRPLVGQVLAYLHASLTAGTDLLFIILPIIVVRQTRLNGKEKLIVVAIMSIGALGCAASLVRIDYIGVLASTSQTFFCKFKFSISISITLLTLLDNSLFLAIWSTVEPGLGIIASSAAITRPLFLKAARSVRSGDISTNYITQGSLDKSETGDMVSPHEITPPASDQQLNKQAPTYWLPRKHLSKFFGVATKSIWAQKRREDALPADKPAVPASPFARKKLSNFLGVPTQAISAWKKQRRDDRKLEIGFSKPQLVKKALPIHSPLLNQQRESTPQQLQPSYPQNIGLPYAQQTPDQFIVDKYRPPSQYDWHRSRGTSWAVRRPESHGLGGRHFIPPSSKPQHEGLPLGIFGSSNPRYDLTTTITDSIVSSATDLQISNTLIEESREQSKTNSNSTVPRNKYKTEL